MSDTKLQLSEVHTEVFKVSVRTALNNIHAAMSRIYDPALPPKVREAMFSGIASLEDALLERNWRDG